MCGVDKRWFCWGWGFEVGAEGVLGAARTGLSLGGRLAKWPTQVIERTVRETVRMCVQLSSRC